jgi:hypothetical protein
MNLERLQDHLTQVHEYLWQAIGEFPEHSTRESRDRTLCEKVLKLARKVADLQRELEQRLRAQNEPRRLEFPHRHFHPERSPDPWQNPRRSEPHAGSDTAVGSSSSSESEELRAREDEEYDRNFDAHDLYQDSD